MNDRVSEADIPGGVPNVITSPIIIVHAKGDKQQYLIFPDQLDPMLNDPRIYGIILSDLLDHIATAYSQMTGRAQKDVRHQISSVMRKENRLKDENPARGDMVGKTILPKRN